MTRPTRSASTGTVGIHGHLLHVVHEQRDGLTLVAPGDLAECGNVGVGSRSGHEDEAVGVHRQATSGLLEERVGLDRLRQRDGAGRDVTEAGLQFTRAGQCGWLGADDLAELAQEQPSQQRDVVMLIAEVDHDDPLPRHRPCRLQAGDRLADTRLAPEQHQLTRTDPSGEQLVERFESGEHHRVLRTSARALM